MAQKILVLDWKGPGDKIVLTPRILEQTNENTIDNAKVYGPNTLRRTTKMQHDHDSHWVLAASGVRRQYTTTLTMKFLHSLESKSQNLDRIMFMRIRQGKDTFADLCYDCLPERYRSMLQPYLCENFDAKLVILYQKNVVPVVQPRVGAGEMNLLAAIYADIPNDAAKQRAENEIMLKYPRGLNTDSDRIAYYRDVINAHAPLRDTYQSLLRDYDSTHMDIEVD